MAAYGPNSPGTAATVSNASGTPWTTPNNALLSDGSYATDAGNSTATGDFLQLTNFGFAVPATETVTGILVAIQMMSSGTNTKAKNVQLLKAGVLSGTDLGTNTPLPTTPSYVSFGDTGNLWGNALTPSDVNASNFGVSLVVGPIAFGSWQASIDHIRITVYTPTYSLYRHVSVGDGMSRSEVAN